MCLSMQRLLPGAMLLLVHVCSRQGALWLRRPHYDWSGSLTESVIIAGTGAGSELLCCLANSFLATTPQYVPPVRGPSRRGRAFIQPSLGCASAVELDSHSVMKSGRFLMRSLC